MMRFVIFALSVLFLTSPAAAYVGPGLGLGVIGVIFGFIFSIILAIVGVVWYPVKRMMKKRKAGAAAVDTAQDETHLAEKKNDAV